MKRLLVTGASGFLGWNLCRAASGQWETFGTTYTHPEIPPGATRVQVDLTDFEVLQGIFSDLRPDGVIHVAAISNADFCQLHPARSERINVAVAVELARLCADRGIPYLFTSSDLVFDGLNPPYREEDPVSPVSRYARQKCMAEKGIHERNPDAAVCRLPLMFGLKGSKPAGVLAGLVEAIQAGKTLRLFVDEYRTPVSGETAAQGILQVIGRHRGTLHLGGRERISRYEFGKLAVRTFGGRKALLVPCTQRDGGTTAPRPPDVSLDSSRAFAMGFSPPPLAEELARIRKILASPAAPECGRID